ncbi:MAG: hypothetical protein COY19_12100 [Candidatus Marinimicrobia bacterium CG_4_10_14_0_2_um_filter_48_9]|nr:MAG: hypothetical protein COY19_12100 [Candidatus Marinimicrobia bacterium CG_4_10_14_0_2_um_filter_48_9]
MAGIIWVRIKVTTKKNSLRRVIIFGLATLSVAFGQFNANLADGTPQPIPAAVRKNFVKSLILPGWGQYSEGNYKRAAAFALIEAATIYGHFYNLNQEALATTDYENYADLHWSFETWVVTEEITALGTEHCGFIQTHNMDYALIDGVYYPNRDSHYYENVGKYNEFVCGWDDIADSTSTSLGEVLTPHKYAYSLMRRQANDYGKKAKYAVTIIMFNHLISAFEAAIGTDITAYAGKNWHAAILPDSHIDRRGLQIVVTF